MLRFRRMRTAVDFAFVGLARRYWLLDSISIRMNVPHHRLPALVDRDMFHRDFLLTLAAMLVQRVHLLLVNPHQAFSMAQVHISARERLIGMVRSPQALHGQDVRPGHLAC